MFPARGSVPRLECRRCVDDRVAVELFFVRVENVERIFGLRRRLRRRRHENDRLRAEVYRDGHLRNENIIVYFRIQQILFINLFFILSPQVLKRKICHWTVFYFFMSGKQCFLVVIVFHKTIIFLIKHNNWAFKSLNILTRFLVKFNGFSD